MRAKLGVEIRREARNHGRQILLFGPHALGFGGELGRGGVGLLPLNHDLQKSVLRLRFLPLEHRHLIPQRLELLRIRDRTRIQTILLALDLLIPQPDLALYPVLFPGGLGRLLPGDLEIRPELCELLSQLREPLSLRHGFFLMVEAANGAVVGLHLQELCQGRGVHIRAHRAERTPAYFTGHYRWTRDSARGVDGTANTNWGKPFRAKARYWVMEEQTAQDQRAREAELLLAVATGEVGALRELYRGFEKPLYSLAMRWLRDPDLAEELVQEVTIRIWRRAGSFNPEKGAAGSWIFGVARNVASDLANAAKRRPTPMDQLPESEGPWDDEASWTSWQVAQALKALPSEQKRIVEMAFVLQMTQSEIAQALSIPLGTVKTRLYAGLKKARLALAEVGLAGDAT